MLNVLHLLFIYLIKCYPYSIANTYRCFRYFPRMFFSIYFWFKKWIRWFNLSSSLCYKFTTVFIRLTMVSIYYRIWLSCLGLLVVLPPKTCIWFSNLLTLSVFDEGFTRIRVVVTKYWNHGSFRRLIKRY